MWSLLARTDSPTGGWTDPLTPHVALWGALEALLWDSHPKGKT